MMKKNEASYTQITWNNWGDYTPMTFGKFVIYVGFLAAHLYIAVL